MRAAVAAVEEAEGAVGVLVNNAGYSQSGAIEALPMERMRAPVRDQLLRPGADVPALPARRCAARAGGEIVNISSMGGRMTFPGGGAYHATKHAVEAMSDALRYEVRGFGVDVVVIEPGLIKTRFGETAAGSIDAAIDGRGPVRGVQRAPWARDGRASTRARWRGSAADPRRSRRRSSARSRHAGPRTRYKVTPSAHLVLAQRRLLTDRAWDGFLRSQFPSPGS